jgi:hypothetical protein
MLLRRYLQEKCGLSRRKLFALMQEWQVLLNDVIVTDFSVQVVDGDIIVLSGGATRTYTVTLADDTKHLIAFHKPIGYVVSVSDPHNQTIYQLLPKEFSHYRYIGRLDKDSRGLLLLSDDLDLVHKLSHPSYASDRRYTWWLSMLHFLLAISLHVCQGVQDGEGDMLRAVLQLMYLVWRWLLVLSCKKGKIGISEGWCLSFVIWCIGSYVETSQGQYIV